MVRKKLIILDRDGVINHQISPYVTSLEKFEYHYGAVKSMSLLIDLGYKICVCSNQQGIAKGLYNYKVLNSIEEKILNDVKPNSTIKFFYCDHLQEQECSCRKPQPGLLNQALNYHQVSAHEAIFVGDNISDYGAAIAAQVDFILLETGHGAKFAERLQSKCKVYKNLHEFSHAMLLRG